MALRFDWDGRKAFTNQKKHGVSFNEAATVFRDEHALLEYDPDHSSPEEDRWVLLGLSQDTRLLVVVHVEIDASKIRLTSARRANPRERDQYRNRSR